MSESTNTMAGLLALNDRNLSPIEVSDILNNAPVVRALFAQKASEGGTTHKFQRDVTDPGVGFRLVNEGITNATGTFDIVTLTCALLDGTVTRDKAVAMAYRKGAQAYMDMEGTKSLRAAFYALERALFASGQNKQFTSLAGNPFFDQITVDSQVVNAGGSTAGATRSVWLLRSAEDGVSMIAGNEGRIDMAVEDATVQARDASNRPYPALMRSMLGWFNIQVGSKYDAARIVNLDGTTGHTLTDQLIAQAAIKAKTGNPFNLIAMSKTSLFELWSSRTATNPTGKEAEWPTGVMMPNGQIAPILVTDGIPEDEAVINTTTTTTTTSTQA